MPTRNRSAVVGAVALVGVLASYAEAAPDDSVAPEPEPSAPAGPPEASPPSEDEVFVQLVADLGEPRHFCLDIPGFPVSGDIDNHIEANWPLEVHTCKTGIENQDLAVMDQLISRSGVANGQLRYTRLDVCLQVMPFAGEGDVVTIREDAPTVVTACADVPEQEFSLGDDGLIRSALDEEKCLTVGEEAFEAGNREPGQPWYRRALSFSTCSDELAERQIWAVVEVPAAT